MRKTLLTSAILLAFTTVAIAEDTKVLTENWEETLSSSLEKTNVQAGDFLVDLKYSGNGVIINSSITSTKDVALTSENVALYTGKNTITGDTVTVKSTAKKGTAIASYGDHTIKANNILVEAGGDALQGSSDMLGDVSLTATDTITIRSVGPDGEAIQGFKGQFNLQAKKVILESVGGQAIGQRDSGSIMIEADDVEISAYQGGRTDDKLQAVRVADGTLTFKVKNTLKVSDSNAEGTAALGVDGKNGKLVIQAKQATIDGDIDATKGKVQLDGEMIFQGKKAEIAELTGDKATFTITKVNQDVSIGNANKALTLAATGDVNDEVGIDALKNIDLSGTTDGVRLVAHEGMSSNETTAILNSKGELTNVVTKTNSVMSNVLDLVSGSTLSMNRILMNDVRKRMGDLRANEGAHGVWARYDGGKLSGDSNFENDFTTIQVGVDTIPAIGAPRFGVAFAYTTTDTDMKRGGAEMGAFSLAFYGTQFYDNGMFVDLIGRMATADTDVTVDGKKKGSMDNVALSLSGEFGWRFDLTDRIYVEPQAELTYTYVDADTLTLTDSSSYEFASVDSLIGRIGFATGVQCPDKFGDIYVRASAVHEFLGDASVTSGRNIHEIEGEDTWFEFGLGANINLNKNTYVYVDVERTEGAKLEEDWRANVGVRYAF